MHMVAAGVVVVALMLSSVLTHRACLIGQLVLQILFLANVIRVVMKSVFKAKNVSTDTLCGAISVYLLVGILSGLLFVLIEALYPGSYRLAEAPANAPASDYFLLDPGLLLYFSFVTLTTVGYGDILPDSEVARSAAVLVAVVGQILLVVQISRLVSIHVTQIPSHTRNAADGEKNHPTGRDAGQAPRS